MDLRVQLDVIMQKMKDFTQSKSTKSTAKPIVVVLLIYAFEEIIKTNNFYNCPKTHYRVYGALFLFGPGACLSLLALLLNRPFWTSVTGCYRGNVNCAKAFKKTFEALLISAFVAYVWLVLAFANSKFYICFRLGPKLSDAAEVVKKAKRRRSEVSEAKAQSTMISCGMLFAVICFVLVLTVVRKCFFGNTDEKPKECFPSVRKYEKLEFDAALIKFKKEMEVLAKQEGEAQVDLYLSRGKEEGIPGNEVIQEARGFLETKYCFEEHSY